MVRGSDVEGHDLVPEWLEGGFVSLSASQLAGIDMRALYEEIQRAVERDYAHKSYAYRSQRLEEFDRFVRQMQPMDLVLVSRHGKVYLGRLLGVPYFEQSESGLSNLRRYVAWLNADDPTDASDLRAPVPALLQSQAYVVDLTEAYPALAALVPDGQAAEPVAAAVPLAPQRLLAFAPVTAGVRGWAADRGGRAGGVPGRVRGPRCGVAGRRGVGRGGGGPGARAGAGGGRAAGYVG